MTPVGISTELAAADAESFDVDDVLLISERSLLDLRFDLRICLLLAVDNPALTISQLKKRKENVSC